MNADFERLHILRSYVRAPQMFFRSTANKMQRFLIYLFLQIALHVSGGFSAHHQEQKLYIQRQVLSTNTAACCIIGCSFTQALPPVF